MEHTKGKWEYSVLNGTQTPATLFTSQDGVEIDIAVFEKWEASWAKAEMEANARRICQCVNNFDEVVETLKSALEWHKGDKWRAGTVSERSQWQIQKNRYEQAIAKAEKGEYGCLPAKSVTKTCLRKIYINATGADVKFARTIS